jgi:methionyl-tRNA synthetase
LKIKAAEMPDRQKFYITTAISYPNGRPHIGHAYELVATDMIARFNRLDGFDVFFLTGTDEHGQKMLQTARKEGVEVRALANRNAAVFQDMARVLNASNDDFIRTTEARHYETCAALWKRMEANGDIYKNVYSGWYSVRDEAYYDESETEVRADNVRYGPQGTPVEWVDEESYFFRLSAYQDKLLAYYESNASFIAPDSRRNEVIAFVKSGLKDLSMSRTTFDWGIPVPGDPKHVMYVWVDALTNYLTATGWPNAHDKNGYWPASVHVIGKDIVRFHAVYWPAFLMSAGLPLPHRVFGHGFLLNKGEKMSKSVGNVLDPFELANGYGVDQLRYFFCREVPFGQDGSYGHDLITNRINADLANDLGNLAQRSLSMINKNCEGRVPVKGELTADDITLLDAAYGINAKARAAIKELHVSKALDEIWAVIADTNRYFAAQAPWVLKKTDEARMATVLWVTAEVLRVVGILVQPVMPESASKLLDLLAVGQNSREFAHLTNDHALQPGTELPAPQGLFPRHVEPTAV